MISKLAIAFLAKAASSESDWAELATLPPVSRALVSHLLENGYIHMGYQVKDGCLQRHDICLTRMAWDTVAENLDWLQARGLYQHRVKA